MLSAWKALRSEATITGYEVPGKVGLGRCAWNFRANESNQVYLKWRANERRAELVRAMPSAADIMKLPSAAENLKE